MNRFIFPALIGIAFFSAEALAQSPCQGSTRVNDLRDLLPGNTVCGTRGNDSWQEQHRGSGTSGELWDYKRGPEDRVDPSKELGTWAITQQGQDYRRITYTYTAFGSPVSYTFEVHDLGNGSYNFCGAGQNAGSNVLGATIRDGVTSCN